MRVIAGELGGRRFDAPPGSGTRPTPERVREALFSVLDDVGGLHLLDLFAGSGALAIEALSRGAARAELVESDRRVAAVIARNLALLGIEDRATLTTGGALGALDAAAAQGALYDLVFIDPPYRRAGALGPALAARLPPLLAPGARVVCESDRRAPLELDGLALVFERRYGDTLLRIHTA